MSTKHITLLVIANGLLAVAVLISLVATPRAVEKALADYSAAAFQVFVANPSSTPAFVTAMPVVIRQTANAVTNIDPCTLMRTEMDGWHVVAAGPLVTVVGRQVTSISNGVVTCATATSTVDAVSWAILEKTYRRNGTPAFFP